MAQLRWSLKAQQDLIEIADYISKDSLLYAIHLIEALVASAERLPRYPRSGRVVPEYGRDDLRELIHGNYRLVYLVGSLEVVVVRVVHAARRLDQAMGSNPLDG